MVFIWKREDRFPLQFRLTKVGAGMTYGEVEIAYKGVGMIEVVATMRMKDIKEVMRL